MGKVIEYCLPFSLGCRPMQDWSALSQIIGTIAAVIFGSVGLYKIYCELRRLNDQRKKELEDRDISARLKRTEFFLAQHRRLFDDKDLYAVLCLVDDDHPELAKFEMWDKKRKYLAFFEEISLLIRSKQISEETAYYMFGYYANCAVRNGAPNFSEGMDMSPVFWGLFYEFVEKATKYLDSIPAGPTEKITL